MAENRNLTRVKAIVAAAFALAAHCTLAGEAPYSAQFSACRTSPSKVHDPCLTSTANQLNNNITQKAAELGEIGFKQLLRDSVHNFLSIRIYQTNLGKACAAHDAAWFQSQNRKYADFEKQCSSQLDGIRQAVRVNWSKMRVLLAVSEPDTTQEWLSSTDSFLFRTDIFHSLKGFAPLNPLNHDEIQAARALAKTDLDQAGEQYGVHNLASQLFSRKLKIGEKLQRNILGQLRRIREKHRNEYFSLLQGNAESRDRQTPLLGFFSNVDLKDPSSPSDAMIASAFQRVTGHLNSNLNMLKVNSADKTFSLNSIDWSQYLSYTPVINHILAEHPQFCFTIDQLENEASSRSRAHAITKVGIGIIAGFATAASGPIGWVGYLSGTALGGKGVYDASQKYDSTLAKNLALGFDDAHAANFAELDDARRELALQEVLLPLAAYRGGLAGAKVVLRTPGGSKVAGELQPLRNATKEDVWSLKETKDFQLGPISPKLETYKDASTAGFKMRNVVEGKNGGDRIVVQRMRKWNDPNRDEGGDIIQDLRLNQAALGEKEASFFGYEYINKDFVTVPNTRELNGAIDRFNNGLSAADPAKIRIKFYESPVEFGSERDYVERFFDKGELPVSQKSRQFLHDINSHGLQGFYMNNEIIDGLALKYRTWKTFAEKYRAGLTSQKDLETFEKVENKVYSEITAAIDKSTNLFLDLLPKIKREGLDAAHAKLLNVSELPRDSRIPKEGILDWDGVLSPLSSSSRDFFLKTSMAKISDQKIQSAFKAFLKTFAKDHPEVLKPLPLNLNKDLKNIQEAMSLTNSAARERELRTIPLSRPFADRLARLQQLESVGP